MPEISVETDPEDSLGIGRTAGSIVVVLSLAVMVFFLVFSVGDAEESSKISYSAGLVLNPFEESLSAKDAGTERILGVPVYDALQGTGDRLPYQASWAQSFTWPLSHVLGWEWYVGFRVFLVSSACLYLSLLTLQSWVGRRAVWPQVILALTSISSAGVFIYRNEWTDTYYQSLGISSAALFILHRADVCGSTPRRLSWLTVAALSVAIDSIVTSHPGVVPICLVTLLSTMIASVTFGRASVRQFVGSVGRPTVYAWLLVVVVTLFVVGLDLLGEGAGQAWSDYRAGRTEGLFSAQALRGVSRGLLPDSLEQIASVTVSIVSLPLIYLLKGFLPDNNDALYRLSGADPRGEFSAIGVLIVAAVALVRRSLSDENRRIALSITGIQLVTTSVALLWHFDQLPVLLSPSAAWVTFPPLMVLNSFLGLVLLRQLSTTHRVMRVGLILSLTLSLSWVASQTGFLRAASYGGGGFPAIDLPLRRDTWFEDSARLIKSPPINGLMAERQRLAVLTTWDRGNELMINHSRFVALTALGIPVVFPADTKIRDSRHLVQHERFEGRSPTLNMTEFSPSYVRKLMSFLQVGAVLIPQNDHIGQRTFREVFATEYQQFAKSSVVLDGTSFTLIQGLQYGLFTLPRGAAGVDGMCSIADQECNFVKELQSHPQTNRSELKICSGRCLWELINLENPRREVFVLPITFDSVLRVSSSSDPYLEFQTENIGGFLAVVLEDVPGKVNLEVNVVPDARMWLRVINSYLNLIAFLTAVLLSVRRSSHVRVS